MDDVSSVGVGKAAKVVVGLGEAAGVDVGMPGVAKRTCARPCGIGVVGCFGCGGRLIVAVLWLGSCSFVVYGCVDLPTATAAPAVLLPLPLPAVTPAGLLALAKVVPAGLLAAVVGRVAWSCERAGPGVAAVLTVLTMGTATDTGPGPDIDVTGAGTGTGTAAVPGIDTAPGPGTTRWALSALALLALALLLSLPRLVVVGGTMAAGSEAGMGLGKTAGQEAQRRRTYIHGEHGKPTESRQVACTTFMYRTMRTIDLTPSTSVLPHRPSPRWQRRRGV